MDDMMNKLQEILSDEESMNQIKKLSEMLASQNSGDMPDFSSIFGNNGAADSGANTGADNSESNMGFDFSKLLQLQQILSQVNQKDPNTEFLYALRPLLKNESQAKIDKIVKLLKLMAMWPIIKDSGLLGGDLFDFL